MNLRNKLEIELYDEMIGSEVKNWASHQMPPRNGRMALIMAASRPEARAPAVNLRGRVNRFEERDLAHQILSYYLVFSIQSMTMRIVA